MDVIFFDSAIIDRDGRIEIALYDGSDDLRAEPMHVATIRCSKETAGALVRDLAAELAK